MVGVRAKELARKSEIMMVKEDDIERYTAFKRDMKSNVELKKKQEKEERQMMKEMADRRMKKEIQERKMKHLEKKQEDAIKGFSR